MARYPCTGRPARGRGLHYVYTLAETLSASLSLLPPALTIHGYPCIHLGGDPFRFLPFK